VEQTEEDYKLIGLDVGVFYGDRKDVGKKHTIATWQSLGALLKRDKKNKKNDLGKLIQDVKCVIVDEAHSSCATILFDLLKKEFAHIPIRIGLTGTIPKQEAENFKILAAIGPIVGRVTAKELQDRDVLAQCRFEIMCLNDRHVKFGDYDSEYRFLNSDETRLKWVSDLCQLLDGNTLLLVNNLSTGRALNDLMPGTVFIEGMMKTKQRRAEFKEISQTSENRITIATFGTMSTGVNVPRIHNLVVMSAGKSFVRVIQSAGRALRKAHDKEFATIYDISSTLRFEANHLKKRKEYYDEAHYTYNFHEVDYL
jgi:superfamily II DNA or RNA helicase